MGILRRIRRWSRDVDNIRDVHVYGGSFLASLGVGTIHPQAGIIVFGAFMAWLGLRAPARKKG